MTVRFRRPTTLLRTSVNICATTIVSSNYLAYAKVLADSIRLHFIEASFFVLVVDRKTVQTEQQARLLGLEIVWAEELGLADFERLAYKFDILELNTALKPSWLKRLLDDGYEAVVYWDPDIRLYSPPSPVIEALRQASIVLTPHTVAPLMDGHRPSDIDLLRHGTYNLGFIAVKDDVDGKAMLDWWEDRCLSHGFSDPVEGVFVDQKWLDLAPSYFENVCILKHRGCNVAYWNLHERPLNEGSAGMNAGEVPLVFFHFSGVDPRNSVRLSKYQNRHAFDEYDLLNDLVTKYCALVMEAGHADLVKTPYSYGCLNGGQPISGLMRRALVCAYEEGSTRPFDPDSTFQRGLQRAGLWPSQRPSGAAELKFNAFNFDAADRRIRILNWAIRAAFRLLGQSRSELLLRYLVFLGRGSHFAAVLTGQPFMLEHQSRSMKRSRSADATAPAQLIPTPRE